MFSIIYNNIHVFPNVRALTNSYKMIDSRAVWLYLLYAKVRVRLVISCANIIMYYIPKKLWNISFLLLSLKTTLRNPFYLWCFYLNSSTLSLCTFNFNDYWKFWAIGGRVDRSTEINFLLKSWIIEVIKIT